MIAFAEDLRSAERRAETNGLAMRVGAECKYCPARTSCPAYAGLDVVEANTVLAKVSGTDLLALDISPGEMHLFIQRLERLIEQAKTRIRAEVLSGVVVERPDGKTLVPNQVSKESISKASILRALGPERGQALLDELREAGALTQISYTEVRAK
jgi:hypothetical protein